MLKDIRIFSADKIWRKILADFDAVVLDSPDTADINLDDLELVLPVSALNLKTAILEGLDKTEVLQKIFGKPVNLSELQTKIVVWLYKSGEMSAVDLKNVSGYSPDMATHAIDTAIYQLRKIYGRDFIQNKDGKYRLGKL